MGAKKENNYVQEASRIELQQLKYFVAVAENLNFSKAAEKLFVSQPLLSQQIVVLENILDSQLFIRSTRDVSLTPVGKLFLTEAKRILEKTDAAVQATKYAARRDNYPQHFRVLCDELYDRAAVTGGAFRFMREHPGNTCEIMIRSYLEAIQMLKREETDLSIAFLEQIPPQDRIAQMVIGRDYFDLIISEDLVGEKTQADVLCAASKIPLLLPERDTRLLNTATQVSAGLGLSPTISFGQVSTDVIVEVELGGAFTFLPHRFANRYKNRGLLRLPLQTMAAAQLTYSACWMKKKSNAMLSVLASYFADDLVNEI